MAAGSYTTSWDAIKNFFEHPLAISSHFLVNRHCFVVNERLRISGLEKEKGMQPSLLLVDDDVSSRGMLAACLLKQGFAVAEASNAEEMRRQLAESRFDIILLDINLPCLR
ncbi:hypothetical protein CCP2SC5_1090001 [Azospirillaceae bacterium]